MRAVCQRVSEARVTVRGELRGQIECGLVVLLGVERGDDRDGAKRLAAKVVRLRIFDGETGKFDRSVRDVGGAALVVSQFTLVADTRKGNRPSFTNAAPPEQAEPLYEDFCAAVAEEGLPVERGV
jgi:D-tyrosyl-tRNA(Tyr) deacylase